MIDRKELKAMAKLRMAQSEPRYWKVMLVWFLAAMVIPNVAVTLGTGPLSRWYVMINVAGLEAESAWWLLMSTTSIALIWLAVVLSVVVTLYQWILNFGFSAYALRLYRGEPCGPSTLFSGFSMAGRVLGAQLLVLLFTLLWALALMIPLLVVVAAAALLPEALMILVFFAAYIAYFVALVVILLRYALVTFALADQPELGALGAIRRSKELMRGYKGSYVLLILSFLGWFLLFIAITMVIVLPVTLGLTFGMPTIFLEHYMLAEGIITVALLVGVLPLILWLQPYMQTTLAGFYDALLPPVHRELPPL